jgi:hypothetical protein
MTSLGGKVKQSVPCCKILQHVKDPYKYGKGYFIGKVHSHFLPRSPTSLLGVSAGNCQTALLDESGMVRTQMGVHNGSEIITVHVTPCVIPPHNRNIIK